MESAVSDAFKSQVKYTFPTNLCTLFFNTLISRALILSKELWSPFYLWRPERWKFSCSTSLVQNHAGEPCALALRLSGAAWLMSTCLILPPKKPQQGGYIQIAYWEQCLSCAIIQFRSEHSLGESELSQPRSVPWSVEMEGWTRPQLFPPSWDLWHRHSPKESQREQNLVV